MKRNTLFTIALLAGMAVNANAEKLYLSSIECISHEFPRSSDFSFKSLFQYDNNDKIAQIETNQFIDEYFIYGGTLQPTTFLFKFEYDENSADKTPSAVHYSDSDGKTVSASDFKTKVSEGSRITEAYLLETEPAVSYTLQSEYNDKDELVAVKRISDRGSTMSKYTYSYNDNGKPTEVKYFDGDEQLMGYWTLQYGLNEELTQCDYYRMESYKDETYKIHCTRHVFTYFDEDTEDIPQIIAPEPMNVIYAIRDINPEMEEIGTFQIPECAAHILSMQKGCRMTSIKQWLHYGIINGGDNSMDLIGTVEYIFELKYQKERPTAWVEAVAADEDAAPEYFNIQGMQVSNPTEGEIYIVKRGSKATKEIYRR